MINYCVRSRTALSSRVAKTARDLTIEVAITLGNLCDLRHRMRSFAPLRMTARVMFMLKFMRPVRTEDEFKLQEDRIDVATRQEKVFLEKIVVVLQSYL